MLSKIKNLQYKIVLLSLSGFALKANAGDETTNTVFKNPISGVKNIYALIYAILDFVAKFGSIIVIFMIIYSGFLFVKAQGNPGDIEKAKSTFFWSVVGAIVLLGAKTLAYVVCNTANGLGAGVSCSLML